MNYITKEEKNSEDKSITQISEEKNKLQNENDNIETIQCLNSSKDLYINLKEKYKMWESESLAGLQEVSSLVTNNNGNKSLYVNDNNCSPLIDLDYGNKSPNSENDCMPLIDLDYDLNKSQQQDCPNKNENSFEIYDNEQCNKNSNLFLKQFIPLADISKAIPIGKFNFLRKGEGTARFGLKNLKKFKQKIKPVNNEKDILGKFEISHLKKNAQKMTPQSKSVENFEKLEELIEHSSFISNSSQTNDLIQASESLNCTPIRENNSSLRKINLHSHFIKLKSPPVKRNILKPINLNSSTPVRQRENNILKPNKVHFPKQGVHVVEYENDIFEDSTTITFEDSDLINISDMEGLIGFNFKNLIQKTEQTGEPKTLLEDNKEIFTCTENDDIDSLKLLLLSKIEYLNEEIKTFRERNTSLQNMIECLNGEKIKTLQIQNDVRDALNSCRCNQKNSSSKSHNKTEKLEEKMSKQLQELFAYVKSVSHDVKDIQENMNEKKGKPFCNTKLLTKNKNKSEVKKPQITDEKIAMHSLTSSKKIGTDEYKKSVDNNSSITLVNVDCEEPTKDVQMLHTNSLFQYQENKKIFHEGITNDVLIGNVDTDGGKLDKLSSDFKKFQSSCSVKKYDDKIISSFPNGSTITKYNDGKEICEFSNGQKETYFNDGSYEILYSDNTSQHVYNDGTEISINADGTVKTTKSDGRKTVQFQNGEREDHFDRKVQRTYPDGTVTLLYPDGKLETRYPNGKIRIKDRNGILVTEIH